MTPEIILSITVYLSLLNQLALALLYTRLFNIIFVSALKEILSLSDLLQ